MTERFFLEDAYAMQADAIVTGHTPEGGIVVDRSVFYATGGGQPGDSGWISWSDGPLEIATAVKADAWRIALVPSEPSALPPVGARIDQHINWTRRIGHMRVHTALHLLSVVLPLPVTGGSISVEKDRLDFNMTDPPPMTRMRCLPP